MTISLVEFSSDNLLKTTKGHFGWESLDKLNQGEIFVDSTYVHQVLTFHHFRQGSKLPKYA